MTITQVGIPQPGIDALSIVAPRVDPHTGQAFASELATSSQALHISTPGKDASLRGVDTAARAHQDAADAADDRAAASDRADRASATDKADRADAADKADRADAADKARSGDRAEAKAKADRSTKADHKTDSPDDDALTTAGTVVPAAVTAQPVVATVVTTAVVADTAPRADDKASAVDATATTSAAATDGASQGIASGASPEAAIAPVLTSVAQTTAASVIQSDVADTKVDEATAKTDAAASKIEAAGAKADVADAKADVTSATPDAVNAKVDAPSAQSAGDQPSTQFDVATQQAPTVMQTTSVAGAAAQASFDDTMRDTAPTTVTTPTSVTPAAQPAATMPIVTDTGRIAATAAPTPVATQLAAHLSNFRGRADGSYETTLTLHPADLGQVSIRIEVLNGTVAIHAMGAHSATVEALRDAMPQLQQELSDAGLNLIGSQVSQQSGQGQQSAERTPAQESAPQLGSTLSTSSRSSEVDPSASTGILGRDGRVDVRV